jgi:DNA-binding GntR family transcriptional regulator
MTAGASRAAPRVHTDAAEAPRNNNDYEPLGNVVTRQVREAILEGRLKPGIRVRQQELARQFGVSRIPVREALRRLESEGLITVVPHSGARVARMDIGECTELYRLRELIEPMALAESVPNLTDQRLAELRGLLSAIEESSEDIPRWLELDRRFHLESYAAAPLPRVLTMIERFWNRTQHYRRAYLGTDHGSKVSAANAEHRLMFDALEGRDPEDAANRLRSHLHRTRTTLTRHPELFEDA